MAKRTSKKTAVAFTPAQMDKAMLDVYLAVFDGFGIYWYEVEAAVGGNTQLAIQAYGLLHSFGLCAEPYLVNDEAIPEGPVLQCNSTYDSISRDEALELFYKATGLTPEVSVAVQAQLETPMEYFIRVTMGA